MRKMLFLAIFAVATPVLATSWAAIPLEVLVDEADLIVIGKVAKIQDGGFTAFNRKYDVAVVEVAGVLKSLSGKPTEVHVAQPAGKQTRTDFYFQPGQQGIWLLAKDPERNVYWTNHPSQFQQEKEKEKLTTVVEARAKVWAGKPVNGLAAWAGVFDSSGNFQVRFGLKNVTDKPIVVCDFLGNKPLEVQWTGPDGKNLKSQHYDWLNAVPTVELKSDFVTIPPGGVRFIGPRGKLTGILFLSSSLRPVPFKDVAPIGKNRVTVRYTNNDNGKKFGLENVWTGTVTANEVSFIGN